MLWIQENSLTQHQNHCHKMTAHLIPAVHMSIKIGRIRSSAELRNVEPDQDITDNQWAL